MSAAVSVRDLSFSYPTDAGATAVLRSMSFDVQEGELVAVLGPSGCGKSTLLRALAGLTGPPEGYISVLGREVAGVGDGVSLIFQSNTLFPWLTVRKNVSFGLRSKLTDPHEIDRLTDLWLDRVQLRDWENNYPGELSGGMLQRASLARALAFGPRLLLLDEPFSSLDALSREEMHSVLLQLWSDTHMTTLLVTHDIDEAVAVADRVLIMTSRPATVGFECTVDLPRPRVADGVRVKGFDEVRNGVAQKGRALGLLRGTTEAGATSQKVP